MAKMQRIITFKLPESLLERIDAYAMRRGMARSEVIREAILSLLAMEEGLTEEAGTGKPAARKTIKEQKAF